MPSTPASITLGDPDTSKSLASTKVLLVVPSSILGYARVVAYDPIQFGTEGFSAPVAPGGTNWIDAVTQDAPVTNAVLVMILTEQIRLN